ncbi:hypothetical protein ACGFY6_25950 [Streptomyces sp. NPDC048387]|uniref:hypothetical protein n=1 Tax=Streptomyces sp. NPDC048387 TaxID=3365542 RepID=UPI00371F367D
MKWHVVGRLRGRGRLAQHAGRAGGHRARGGAAASPEREQEAKRKAAADLPAYPSTRTSAPLPATCPTPDVDHCGNCGTTVAIGGWMIASLGLSCPDCYDVMSGEPGRHDLRYHRQR